MKVITHPIGVYQLVFIPRKYKEYIGFELTSEITQEKNGLSVSTTHETPVTDIKGYNSIIVDLFSLDVVEGDTLTIKLSDNDGVVYRGKMYATNEADLENFQLIEVNNNVIDL